MSPTSENADGTAVPIGNTYDKYGTTNPIEQRMMSGFFSRLDALLGEVKPQRILEIGMGEGHVAVRVGERFPDVPFVGLDLADDELATSWTELGVPGMFADSGDLPFPDDTFDLVLAIEVFEHFDAPGRALAEVARVCNGSLIASVPFEPIWRLGNMARGRYLRQLGNTPGHVNHWTSRSFSRFIATQLDVQSTARPLPWTMLHAHTR